MPHKTTQIFSHRNKCKLLKPRGIIRKLDLSTYPSGRDQDWNIKLRLKILNSKLSVKQQVLQQNENTNLGKRLCFSSGHMGSNKRYKSEKKSTYTSLVETKPG